MGQGSEPCTVTNFRHGSNPWPSTLTLPCRWKTRILYQQEDAIALLNSKLKPTTAELSQTIRQLRKILQESMSQVNQTGSASSQNVLDARHQVTHPDQQHQTAHHADFAGDSLYRHSGVMVDHALHCFTAARYHVDDQRNSKRDG